jgi:hypothetical protein
VDRSANHTTTPSVTHIASSNQFSSIKSNHISTSSLTVQQHFDRGALRTVNGKGVSALRLASPRLCTAAARACSSLNCAVARSPDASNSAWACRSMTAEIAGLSRMELGAPFCTNWLKPGSQVSAPFAAAMRFCVLAEVTAVRQSGQLNFPSWNQPSIQPLWTLCAHGQCWPLPLLPESESSLAAESLAKVCWLAGVRWRTYGVKL